MLRRCLTMFGIFLLFVGTIGLAFFLAEGGSQPSSNKVTWVDSKKLKNPQALETGQVLDGQGQKKVLASSRLKKPRVLIFWASWCPDCQGTLPHLEALRKEYGKQVDFVFVNLVDGKREKEGAGQAYMKEKGYEFDFYWDPQMSWANQLGIEHIPTIIFQEADGLVQTSFDQAMAYDQLASEVKNLINK